MFETGHDPRKRDAGVLASWYGSTPHGYTNGLILYGKPGQRGEVGDCEVRGLSWHGSSGAVRTIRGVITWFGKAVTLPHTIGTFAGIKFTSQVGQLFTRQAKARCCLIHMPKKRHPSGRVEFAYVSPVCAGRTSGRCCFGEAARRRVRSMGKKPRSRHTGTRKIAPVLALSVLRWLAAGQRSRYLYPRQGSLEPEIAESLLRLDKNKVRIAKRVRGNGFEDTGLTTARYLTEVSSRASSKAQRMEISPLTMILMFFGGVYVALGAGYTTGFGVWMVGMSLLIELGNKR